MKMNLKDPKNYSFFVHDNGELENNISVVVWITTDPDSWHGDQELEWEHEDFEQVMESTYAYCGSKELTKAEIHDYLIQIGLTFGKKEAQDCNINNPQAYIPPTKLTN